MTARRTAIGALNLRRLCLVQRPVNVISRRVALVVALFILISASTIDAQRPTADAFEVVSIKLRTGDRVGTVASAPDRFIRPDTTLRDLIRYAYDLQDFQIDGGPGWSRTSRFEVTAKAATAPAAPDGMRALVRRMLQDRFALKTHVEPRELSLYEMVVARRDRRLGERLRQSALDCEAIMSGGSATADDRVRCDLRFRPKVTTGDNGRPTIASMTLILQGTTMARLAALLQNEARRAIVDKTGLTGTFDLELEFAPQGPAPAGLPSPAPSSSEGPPLLTAIQEQLGLRLEPGRGQVPVLVIDSAEMPAPD